MSGNKYWEIIADNLSKAGWSWGLLAAIDSNGRTIWIADAHRDDGKRFRKRERIKVRGFSSGPSPFRMQKPSPCPLYRRERRRNRWQDI
jgi:hypothetical protein